MKPRIIDYEHATLSDIRQVIDELNRERLTGRIRRAYSLVSKDQIWYSKGNLRAYPLIFMNAKQYKRGYVDLCHTEFWSYYNHRSRAGFMAALRDVLMPNGYNRRISVYNRYKGQRWTGTGIVPDARKKLHLLDFYGEQYGLSAAQIDEYNQPSEPPHEEAP